MKIIGLTGSICSGKSTIAQFLAQMGAAVINADEIGHEALSLTARLGSRWSTLSAKEF